jgi:hypothetical protein
MAAQAFTWVPRDTREWRDAWNGLIELTHKEGINPTRDPGQTDARSGESWQYMGTVDGTHEFRHRHHPYTGQREYRRVR